MKPIFITTILFIVTIVSAQTKKATGSHFSTYGKTITVYNCADSTNFRLYGTNRIVLKN
jgi:hypothetical protein